MSCARSFWPPSGGSPLPTPLEPPRADATGTRDVCDVCGDARLAWRKCKQVCLNCGTILRSCADL